MLVLTAEQAAAVDRFTIDEFGVPSLVLMETAGRALVRVVETRYADDVRGGIAVVAGPGNNGGDGFVAARAFYLRGLATRVFLLGAASRLRGDAAHNFNLLRNTAGDDVPIHELSDESALILLRSVLATSRICIDACFGTGLARPLDGLHARAIGAINECNARVVAVDIPSGVNGTSGAIQGVAVAAHATVCVGFLKRGLLLYPGAACCGDIYVAEIGFPRAAAAERSDGVELVEPEQIQRWLPRRPPTAHKGTAGRLTIVAGSLGMAGAPMLTARGALRSGAGLVTLCLPASLSGLHAVPIEALTRDIADDGSGHFTTSSATPLEEAVRGASAVALGPGCGRDDTTVKVLRDLLDGLSVPSVVDADALRAIPASRVPSTDRVLTPHPGEMSTLLDRPTTEVLADPIGAARACARRFGVVALLKGAHTVIAAPDGRLRINFTGNPGMASGGMGDTLTGVIGTLLAQNVPAFEAAATGAFLHGRAADRIARSRGERGLLAHDVADELPSTIDELLHRPQDVPFPVSV